MKTDLRALLRSNYVIRYHANPDLARFGDTDGHHQAMVVQIIFALHPAPPMALIYAAAHHDCGEAGVGDNPSTLKDIAPALSNLLEYAESRQRAQMRVHWVLEDAEYSWLKFADRLAAYAHVLHVAPHVLGEKDWRGLHASLQHNAEAYDVWPQVMDVIGRYPSEAR